MTEGRKGSRIWPFPRCLCLICCSVDGVVVVEYASVLFPSDSVSTRVNRLESSDLVLGAFQSRSVFVESLRDAAVLFRGVRKAGRIQTLVYLTRPYIRS